MKHCADPSPGLRSTPDKSGSCKLGLSCPLPNLSISPSSSVDSISTSYPKSFALVRFHYLYPRTSTTLSYLDSPLWNLSFTQQPGWPFRLTNQITSLLKPFPSPPVMPRENPNLLRGSQSWLDLAPASLLPLIYPGLLLPVFRAHLHCPLFLATFYDHQQRETSHPAIHCHISFSVLGKTLIKSIIVLSF